jgi:Response regulator containing CheY-like receiver, AAA-type ATPase, and DNA-binding domains
LDQDSCLFDPKLLIVEDDDHIRNIFQTCFEKYCDVSTVESGEDALEYIDSHLALSVVILDIGLDKLTGDMMVKTIKEKN